MFFIVIIIYNGLVQVLSHLIFFHLIPHQLICLFFQSNNRGSAWFTDFLRVKQYGRDGSTFQVILVYLPHQKLSCPHKKVSPMERHLGQVQKSMHVTFTVKNSCHFPRVSCIQRSYFFLYYSLKETESVRSLNLKFSRPFGLLWHVFRISFLQ